MKDQYLQAVKTVITALAQNDDRANLLFSAYFERNFGAGAANEITDEDVIAAGMQPGDLARALVVFEQLGRFMRGEAPATGNYRATLTAIRGDV